MSQFFLKKKNWHRCRVPMLRLFFFLLKTKNKKKDSLSPLLCIIPRTTYCLLRLHHRPLFPYSLFILHIMRCSGRRMALACEPPPTEWWVPTSNGRTLLPLWRYMLSMLDAMLDCAFIPLCWRCWPFLRWFLFFAAPSPMCVVNSKPFCPFFLLNKVTIRKSPEFFLKLRINPTLWKVTSESVSKACKWPILIFTRPKRACGL